jgi:hypothetical protein
MQIIRYAFWVLCAGLILWIGLRIILSDSIHTYEALFKE